MEKSVKTYEDFLYRKTQSENNYGFVPASLPNFLFDFHGPEVYWRSVFQSSNVIERIFLIGMPVMAAFFLIAAIVLAVTCYSVLMRSKKPPQSPTRESHE